MGINLIAKVRKSVTACCSVAAACLGMLTNITTAVPDQQSTSQVLQSQTQNESKDSSSVLTIATLEPKVQSVLLKLQNFNLNIGITPAEARTYINNGIALNANGSGAYGTKHGKPQVSQFAYQPGDSEQENFEDISLGNGKKLIKSHLGCVNSHQTKVGSVPNFFPCDRNDPDQQFQENTGNTIIHAASGLKLNLGVGSDQVVRFVNNYVAFNQNQNPPKSNQPDLSKLKYQTSGIGWNAPIVYDLNVFSPTFNHLLLGDGKKVKVNLSEGSIDFHTYTYFNKEEGAYLKYNLDMIKGDMTAIAGTGFGSFVTATARKYPLISGILGVGGLLYSHDAGEISTRIEFCLSKDSGFWLDAYGGALFANPKLKCDK